MPNSHGVDAQAADYAFGASPPKPIGIVPPFEPPNRMVLAAARKRRSMKKILRWISLALFALLSIFLIWFGWVYATADNLLWFHAAAVPEAAREEVRPLYFALMTLIGGAAGGLGVLGLFVTLAFLRRGDPYAALGLSIAFAIPFVMAAVTAEKLANATGAPTSWHIMGVLLAMTALALLAHAGSCKAASAAPRRAPPDPETF